MKDWKGLEWGVLIGAVVLAVVAAVMIGGPDGGYQLISEKQRQEEIDAAYRRGKAAVTVTEQDVMDSLEEMENDYTVWYDLGYEEGYADGYADGQEEGEPQEEAPASQSTEQPSSSQGPGSSNTDSTGSADTDTDTGSSGGTSSTSSTNQQPTITVYITDWGNAYHRSGCKYLWNSSSTVTLSDAKACGYVPCSVCDPPA